MRPDANTQLPLDEKFADANRTVRDMTRLDHGTGFGAARRGYLADTAKQTP